MRLPAPPIFRGELPRIAPDNLPEGYAAVAIEANLFDGNLSAWNGLDEQLTLAKAGTGTVVSIFPMDLTGADGGPYWLHWTQEELGAYANQVHVARGLIPGDPDERIYFTGTDAPRVTTRALATTGDTGDDFPYASYKLGVPAPAAAPTIALVDSIEEPGTVTINNPGAEAGASTGWTVTTGDLDRLQAGDVSGMFPFEGTWYFYGGAAAAVTEAYQSFDLESENILPGQALSLNWRQARGVNGSQGILGLRFYDGSSNLIGETFSSPNLFTFSMTFPYGITPAPPNTWVPKSLSNVVVPQEAREVRLVMRMTRVGGSINDAFFDAIEMEVSGDSQLRYDGSSLEGWSTRTTANAALESDDGEGWPAPAYRFTASSDGVAAMYRDFALSRTSRIRIKFNYYTNGNYEIVTPSLVLGADASGKGTSIVFRPDGAWVADETSWLTSGTASRKADDGNHRNVLFFLTMFVERSGPSKAVVSFFTQNAETGTPISVVSDFEIDVYGDFIGFKGSNSNRDSHSGWLDNIEIKSTAPDEPAEARNKLVFWFETYVNLFGEESAPSDPSRTVQFSESVSAQITSATVPPSGFGITKKRRYRAVNSTTGAVMKRVEEIDVGTATTTDSKQDDELGDVLEPTEFWLPPPAELRGIQSMANGITAGVVDNQWIPTPPNRPHAWLADAAQVTDYPIVAWIAQETDAVVATQASTYVITGTDPYSMGMTKPEPFGCVSERSMVWLGRGFGAAFAGPDGLVGASRNGVGIISAGVIDEKKWRLLNPSSIWGVAHEGRYYGFWEVDSENRGGFIFDPAAQGDGWVPLNFYATAGYSNPRDGNLYLVVDGDLMIWDGDADAKRTYRYRSPLYLLPRPASFAIAQIHVQGTGALTFRLFYDGVQVLERSVTSSMEFNLPDKTGDYSVQWELEGTRTVRRWPLIAEDVDEIEV